MNCIHEFFNSEKSSKICWNCGLEENILNNCTYKNCGFNSRHSPFLSGYSRSKRFRGMVESLFWPSPSNGDTAMLKFLFRHTPFRNRTHIVRTMAHTTLKDKRFTSIHVFCRLFEPFYRPPKHKCLFRMAENLIREFEGIESRFHRLYPTQPFINYTFLLAFLLKRKGYFQYIPYVKRLKSKKRKERYEKMLDRLCPIPEGELLSCGGTYEVISGTVLNYV